METPKAEYIPSTKSVIERFHAIDYGAYLVVDYGGNLRTLRSALSRSCADKRYKAGMYPNPGPGDWPRLEPGGTLRLWKKRRGKPEPGAYTKHHVVAYRRTPCPGTMRLDERPSRNLLRMFVDLYPKYRPRVIPSGNEWLIVKTLK